jgi:short-subunit dehydrogenase
VTKRALISGASSGIGEALARELSSRGWELALLARRGDVLAKLAAELPRTVGVACDVRDSAAVHDAVRSAESQLGGPFDLVIANAGIGVPSFAFEFNIDDAEQMVRVNLLGMLYLFDAVIPSMIERGRGRFAGVASIAGHRGLPSSSVYSATKSAMQSFLDASRVELKPLGVDVTIINPGFVATPMTEKNKSMPFLWQAPRAAKYIADRLERGKAIIEFPLPMSILTRTLRFMPRVLFDRLTVVYAKRKIDRSKLRR